MRKTYKYRLYPTESQVTNLNSFLYQCRWVFNETLELRKTSYEKKKKSVSLYATNKHLTKWKKKKKNSDLVNKAHSQCLQHAQTRVDLAYKAFFKRVKSGEKPGYPRFKGQDRYDSFTFTQSGFKLNAEDKELLISKIGKVKIVYSRKIKGDIKQLTVLKKNDKWYACFSVEYEAKPLPILEKFLGIDLGVASFYTDSDGNSVDNPRFFKKMSNDIARFQRKTQRAKNKKDWKAHKKYKKALNKKWEKVTNQRGDFAHKLSRKLVNKNQIICLEKLNITGMTSKDNKISKTLNKSIMDCAWNQFTQYVTYKAAEAGRCVVLVNPRNTSQMCSGCEKIVKKKLSERVHKCPHCKLELDRDHNAAKNILRLGLQSLGELKSNSVEARLL